MTPIDTDHTTDMPVQYADRNSYSTAVCWRFPSYLIDQIGVLADALAISKSQVVQNAVGVYLGQCVNNDPMIKDAIMAIAKKKVAVKAKAAKKPAAKPAAAKKK